MRFWVTISLLLLASGTFGAQEEDTASAGNCFFSSNWTNCANTYASDDSDATNTSSGSFRDSSFAFSITGASLDSLVVLVEGTGSSFITETRGVDVWFSRAGTN